jgi:hypothetical protein
MMTRAQALHERELKRLAVTRNRSHAMRPAAAVIALALLATSAVATPLASATKATSGSYGYCAHCYLLKAPCTTHRY